MNRAILALTAGFLATTVAAQQYQPVKRLDHAEREVAAARADAACKAKPSDCPALDSNERWFTVIEAEELALYFPCVKLTPGEPADIWVKRVEVGQPITREPPPFDNVDLLASRAVHSDTCAPGSLKVVEAFKPDGNRCRALTIWHVKFADYPDRSAARDAWRERVRDEANRFWCPAAQRIAP